MDYNNNEPISENISVQNNNDNSNKSNGMATASLVLGILAVISICCVYGSYIFGSIAITLGLLSRGRHTKLSKNALIGTILSIVGMVISTFIIVLFCISILANFGSFENFLNNYDAFYENIYGEDYPFDSNTFDFNHDNSDSNYDIYEDEQPPELDLPNTLTIHFD